MDNLRRTRIFVELYTTALKASTKNQWLSMPKEGGEKWKMLEAARATVDELGGDYADFIRVQFAALQKFGQVPSPSHLCSKNAIQRYTVFQKMKNKYHHKTYSVEGDEFVVHSTGKRYPISQADLPIQKDPTANYAQYLATTGELPVDRPEAILSVEYAIAKLKYKDKVPTDSMVRILRRLKEEK